ncbi:MAG: hypothetical protein IH623_00175 [Verrucomicrobia bacterium]|nr:hypothetical protein [Verrucomicrobiota bacterium]
MMATLAMENKFHSKQTSQTLAPSRLRACLNTPERGCVVLDQPQQASIFRRVEDLVMCCGWSSTQPRSFFRQPLGPEKLRQPSHPIPASPETSA